MHFIDERNVADALPSGIALLHQVGQVESTRAGDCLVAPGPVLTRLRRPDERVLFSAARDANPFFHLVESLWMLSGRDDAQTLNNYVADFGQRFAESSSGKEYWEAGGVIHGAYGHRWRRRFKIDQLECVVERLRKDPKTRQCVIQMWDCYSSGLSGYERQGTYDGANDLMGEWKDRPCNTHVYLRAHPVIGQGSTGYDHVLDLTVCNRSHDIVWGLFGANAVHFSVLQEYLAARTGMAIGDLYFMSNNFHAYVEFLEQMRKKTEEDWSRLIDNRYGVTFRPSQMFEDHVHIDVDLETFFKRSGGVYHNRWFHHTAERAVAAHEYFKTGELERARDKAYAMESVDWGYACAEWIQRRIDRRKNK